MSCGAWQSLPACRMPRATRGEPPVGRSPRASARDQTSASLWLRPGPPALVPVRTTRPSLWLRPGPPALVPVRHDETLAVVEAGAARARAGADDQGGLVRWSHCASFRWIGDRLYVGESVVVRTRESCAERVQNGAPKFAADNPESRRIERGALQPARALPAFQQRSTATPSRLFDGTCTWRNKT